MRHRTAILLAIEAFASGRGATESVAVTHPSHQPIQLAVTIDDRPWVGRVHEGETWLSASRRLLATLKRRGQSARCRILGIGAREKEALGDTVGVDW